MIRKLRLRIAAGFVEYCRTRGFNDKSGTSLIDLSVEPAVKQDKGRASVRGRSKEDRSLTTSQGVETETVQEDKSEHAACETGLCRVDARTAEPSINDEEERGFARVCRYSAKEELVFTNVSFLKALVFEDSEQDNPGACSANRLSPVESIR